MSGSTDDQTVETPVDELSDSVTGIWENVADALPRLGLALAVVIVGWLLSQLVRIVLTRILCSRQTPSFARVISRLVGWTIAFLFALAASAVAFPSVKPVDLLAGLGFFSVAVGFAFQDILENTLSGVLLLFRQPFRSGDQIEVQDQKGTVEAITIRETRITTFDGQLIVIPNRDVYKSVIRVQTHHETRRLAFVTGIAYEADPSEAIEVILDALADVEGVDQEPAPEAVIRNLGVSTVDIEVRFWARSPQRDAVLATHRAIVATKRALDDAGVEMPADIVALQATPSFKAAIQGDGDPTPGGALR